MTKNKSIVIAGSGPSITKIDYRRLPETYDVLRINNFFFEDKYYLGKKVDYWFAHPFETQFFHYYHLQQQKEYSISNLLSSPTESYMNFKIQWQEHFGHNPSINERVDYWKYYHHILSSSGLTALIVVLDFGYSDIYLSGIDLSMTSSDHSDDGRYVFDKGPVYRNYIKYFSNQARLNPVTADFKHSENCDRDLLTFIDSLGLVNIYSISEDSPINEFIDLAPIQNNNSYQIEDKPENYTKDWLVNPTMERKIADEKSTNKLKKLIRNLLRNVKNFIKES